MPNAHAGEYTVACAALPDEKGSRCARGSRAILHVEAIARFAGGSTVSGSKPDRESLVRYETDTWRRSADIGRPVQIAVSQSPGHKATIRYLEIIGVVSAGMHPVAVNPRAIAVMAEAEIDISLHRSKRVDELAGRHPDVVISVCDRAKDSYSVVSEGPRCWTGVLTTHPMLREQRRIA
jgi:hypothetical protein